MRDQWRLALAIFVGFVGALLPSKPFMSQGTAAGAYVIVDINQINDPATCKTFLGKEAQTITSSGGRFLTRTNYITPLDGVAPLRFAIIAFDNVQKAQAWNVFATQTDINAKRMKSTRSSSYIVEVEGTK